MKYLKWDMDTEIIGCGYFAGFLLMYCLVNYFLGEKTVDMLVIIEMLIIGYAISYTQRFVFAKYERLSNSTMNKRFIVWSIIVFIAVLVAGYLFGWCRGFPWWCIAICIIFLYSGIYMVWYFNYAFMRKDSEVLMKDLSEYKNRINEQQ